MASIFDLQNEQADRTAAAHRVTAIDSEGNTIKQDLLASYAMSDFDAETSLIYIGYLDKNGKWFIKKIDVTSDIGTALYTKGDSGYSTAWSDRTTLTYDTFDNIF